MRLRRWTTLSVSCVATVTMLALTGCCTSGQDWPTYEHPRQGQYLYLEKGQEYTAPAKEKWVSPALLREKDQLISEQQATIEKLILPDE